MWVKTEKSNYEDIADAIRTKSGSSDTFLPSEMAAAIQAIPSGSSVLTDCNRKRALYGQCSFSDGTTTERLSITPTSGTKYFLSVCEVFAENTNTLTHIDSGYAFALTDASGNIIASGNGGTAGTMTITTISNFYQFAVTITEDTTQTAQYVMRTIYEIK